MVAVSSNTQKQIQSVKQNDKTKEYFPNEENKTAGKKNLKETKIRILADKTFKIIVRIILSDLRRKINEQ